MLDQFNIWHSLKAVINDRDLKNIADSDYFAHEEHFEALKQIVQTNSMPPRLNWEPGEAIALTRWSEYQPGTELSEKPEIVLFSCILLLAALCGEESSSCDGASESVIIALDIACQLGEQWVIEYNEFLAELIKHESITPENLEEDFLYLSLGQFLSSRQDEMNVNDVVQAELDYMRYVSSYDKKAILEQDIFTHMCFDQKIALWMKFFTPLENDFLLEREQQLNAILKTSSQRLWNEPLSQLFQKYKAE